MQVTRPKRTSRGLVTVLLVASALAGCARPEEAQGPTEQEPLAPTPPTSPTSPTAPTSPTSPTAPTSPATPASARLSNVVMDTIPS